MALLVHLLACAFGTGSWVAINGLWVELPLIVNELPEGWYLPSYLTVIIQLANVGPLLVTLMYKFCPGRLTEVIVVYMILSIGTVSCFLLAFFWKETTVVAGELHSTAFLIITFFLSLLDCTSSVTFLPFMMQLPAQYLTTYFIGEGLSGFIPGLVALGQGVGMTKCVNVTQGWDNMTETNVTSSQADHYTTESQYQPANFSTEIFFFFLAGMMGLCLVAFIFLTRIPRNFERSCENLVADQVVYTASSGLENSGKDPTGEAESNELTISVNLQKQEASTLPSKARSLMLLGSLSLAGTGFGAYNMAMAAMSPCPLLQNSLGGGVLIVLSWIFFVGTLSYVKVMVGLILRDKSHSALVWCGVAVQMGSMVGALAMFPLINVYYLFKSGDSCNTNCSI
ncbi:solute carrier family 52, riboflavin transporter, member 3-A isoform X2 [Polyodon spathula]|uniref:solute carrier family 52, riboflavin transporter, member 3-A isoform X2 n=1 Tax=Polyodon spathula TaxID=7913 RepID=UPI001B7E1F46|nr:solute carrier family 52, riboflavin transporter, member 3-A isoform X2 [Polyodon spathula]